ncbi:glycosyltransferase [Pseudonocardia acidicola]|uniref:Glycosyltransferase family 28 n=1 Tax=Pseudonocardia acidicola TaxID=2724939 RepID=A0ABX1SJE8_9PSEU|nr:glycosyltransferase [Pseudonocardia acidicola]NMI00274.1 glycosyltransferase family 28 [Pseudonocardia acidicola]
MTTLFLATTGGHLTQLSGLAERIPRDPDSLWVTHENEQSLSMLAGREVEYVPYVGVRDVRGVLRCLPHAHALLRRRGITRAVSTGSGIALGYLPYLAARGVACHYIESAARVGGPSMTGRILRRVPRVRTYTQYRHWSDAHWHYGGNGFDVYEPAPRQPRLGDRIRVVVTLGTATEFPFRRLVVPLSKTLAAGGDLEQATGLPVEVLWQTGGTPVGDLPLTATPFLPAADLWDALARADIVVSHAGGGSALANLAAGRFAIMVDRFARYGESNDDHQRELAQELAARGLVLHRDAGAVTVSDLLATLQTAVRRVAAPRAFELLP